MCCFKDFKNFERLNNIVQVAMNLAIKFIHTLPQVRLVISGGLHQPQTKIEITLVLRRTEVV